VVQKTPMALRGLTYGVRWFGDILLTVSDEADSVDETESRVTLVLQAWEVEGSREIWRKTHSDSYRSFAFSREGLWLRKPSSVVLVRATDGAEQTVEIPESEQLGGNVCAIGNQFYCLDDEGRLLCIEDAGAEPNGD